MAARWFRFYTDAMRNPKVASLNDTQFRLWVELLSVASENDGRIPPLDDLKHVLKRRLDHLSRGVKELISAGLMDALTTGYEPHNWAKFQYKSDVSTNRVRKNREKRNVSETPPDTDTDTDTDIPLDKSNGATPSSDKQFWDNAKSYLGKKNAGMIGKWAKEYGQEATAKAITAAQIERAVDPVPYIQRVLIGTKPTRRVGI